MCMICLWVHCRNWLLIKSCSALSKISGSPIDAFTIASVAQLSCSRLERDATRVNAITSQGAIATKFCFQAGCWRSLAWLWRVASRQNLKVLSTATIYDSPALNRRVAFRFGVISGYWSAIAIRQTPVARYNSVNRVNCLIVFSLWTSFSTAICNDDLSFWLWASQVYQSRFLIVCQLKNALVETGVYICIIILDTDK